ncbi:MAB_1171c family putative transporter [Nocardia sp. bgisy118]|uniref:MAB_1171c family putative transporter n=1 Tax=Nocardia sp. bgisy118 TaxID=3413786 RepID=UPI003F4A6C80
MTSPLPATAALPIIATTSTITVLRWRLINQTPTDKLINRTLAWGVVGQLLHERGVAPGIASLLHQLSLGAILASLSGIYGIAKLWGGADPETTGQRQRRYDGVIIGVFILLLIAGTPARRQGLLIDQALGSPAVAFWAIFGAPLAVCAALLLQITVRDFRTEDLTLREKVFYGAIFAAAGSLLFDAFAGPAVAALSTYTDFSAHDEQMSRKATTFFASALIGALIVAVPLFPVLAEHFGWDRTSRHARRLQPLWRDLTTAFPDLVLYPATELAKLPPTPRLHRMTIEIRDILLNLRPYMSVTTDTAPALPDEMGKETTRYAILVAHALDTKRAGTQPDPVGARTVPRAPEATGDLDSEIQVLLELARQWPHAQTAVVATYTSAPATPNASNKEQPR